MAKKNNQRKEIIWNVINSALGGALVFFGAVADGDLSWRGIALAGLTSLVIAITRFKEYWATQESEYSNKMFTFIKAL